MVATETVTKSKGEGEKAVAKDEAPSASDSASGATPHKGTWASMFKN